MNSTTKIQVNYHGTESVKAFIIPCERCGVEMKQTKQRKHGGISIQVGGGGGGRHPRDQDTCPLNRGVSSMEITEEDFLFSVGTEVYLLNGGAP